MESGKTRSLADDSEPSETEKGGSIGSTAEAAAASDARPRKRSCPESEDSIEDGEISAGCSNDATIDAVPSDVLGTVMVYVGPGRYRYVAGTCRRFREAYAAAHHPSKVGSGRGEEDEEEEAARSISERHETLWSAAAESISCAALCIRESPEDFARDADCVASRDVFGGFKSQLTPRVAVRRVGEAAALMTGSLDVILWLEKEHELDANFCSEMGYRRSLLEDSWGWNEFSCFYHRCFRLADERKLLDCAALGGHMNIVRHYNQNGCFWDDWTGALAAKGGHIGVLKYLLGNGCRLSSITWSGAARGGQVGVLRYLHGLGKRVDKGSIMDATMEACVDGHLNAVKFLQEVRPVESHEGGSERMIRRIKEDIVVFTAGRGHAHVIEYLHSKGFPMKRAAFKRAAESGQLNVLKYFHLHNVPWGTEVCTAAAANNHFEALQFLVRKGCPFDEGEVIFAACGWRNTAAIEWIETYSGAE